MDESLHVGLLYGGRSPEHDVSIDSAGNVFEVLRETHRVTPIYIDREGRWHVEDAATARLHAAEDAAEADDDASGHASDALLAPADDGAEVRAQDADALDALALDVVLPMLHGPNGEDGRVQGLLDVLGLPFVGAGVLGSAACMDKEVTKRLLRDGGLPIVPFRVLRYGDDPPAFEEIADALGVPFFVKPANAGSSVGASKVTGESAYRPALDSALEFDNKVLIETAIDGREIECAVIGNEEPRATVPGEIVSEAEFYTYDAKYDAEADQARMEVPADLPAALAERIRTLAADAYRLLNCEGFARVDFFVTTGEAPAGGVSAEDSEHTLFINEINTIPGFTARSMFPVMWEHMDLPNADLLDTLLQLALDRHERDARIKMTL